MLIGGPGDGEVIPGLHNHGTYFRFRSEEERTKLGDHLGDTYVLVREGDALVGQWIGPDLGGAPTRI